MRARYPDHEGVLDRDGVGIHYEVYGEGDTTLLLIPPAPITHSRIWKALIPHLARHYRVVTFDGRGNGRSGRPVDKEAHGRAVVQRDILGVLEATGTTRAVVVAHCHANWWAVELAFSHPELVAALVAIEPGVPYLGTPQPHWVETGPHWDEVLEDPSGWELNNRHAMVTRHRQWIEFFFGEQLVEPHSTKQYQDAVEWAMESSGEVLAAGEEGFELDWPERETVERICRELEAPTLTIHGELDICQHVDRGRAFAEITNGELIVIEGAGHLTVAREPVKVNRAIEDFVDRTEGKPMKQRVWSRGLDRRKRALYVSSPIGLGHARRDIAIARELRKLEPDLEIEWLAQDPVTRVLAGEGETVHPASDWLASESAHFVSEASGHDLHCFQALRRMDEILVANFMIFQEVLEEGLHDLVLGDEAWEVDHFWHENPELKRGAHVWMTDFVGYLPMPSGGDHEEFLTADYNAEMIEHVARYPRIRDRAVFVGGPDDVVPELFGPGLPKIRDWTEQNFDFSGYITGFEPPTPDQAAAWRAELGYDDEEKVCIVTVGGSGVGRDLLQKVIAAYPMAKRALPELRMVVVAGPRIDPAGLPSHEGLEYHGYIHRLYRHLAACDLAIVQGGLTTTMELTAAKRPFLYFPLQNHFEQNYHVRHRLDRYRAGRHMDYADTDPDAIAAEIVAHAGVVVDYLDVESDGAARAATMIAELI
ncbi:MAG TPA: alpha/beta fold hydrolase [Acidimicrobiia bacterium]|nr:alpha/beta fold hydrolase [Acidimicrobiia bacterium]